MDKNRVIYPGFMRFRSLLIFLECHKPVSKGIQSHSSVINMRYYPYELSRMCETPFFKEPKSPKWGGARFASIQMEVLNAPPHKIFRNGGVRVSLPFPFFHCFVENPLKIPLKNFRLRRA